MTGPSFEVVAGWVIVTVTFTVAVVALWAGIRAVTR